MPITSSAKKALRVAKRRAIFNIRRKRAMSAALKGVRKLIAAGKKDEAVKLLPQAFKAIDKAAKRGVIKSNNADRAKSRLAKAVR